MRFTHLCPLTLAAVLVPALALAQPAATADRTVGPEATALVSAPAEGKDAPEIKKSSDALNAALSAGGMLTTGNTRTQALTLNGTLDLRRGMNGFGFSALGNYGSSKLAGQDSQTTAENFQLRGRYERYFTDRFAAFLQLTERYDRFQGIASRTNIDPGAKFVFWKPENSALWGELGYDFQYDVRTQSGRHQMNDDGTEKIDPATGGAYLYDKTMIDHSARAFVGFRHAFSKEVTLSTGLEYLQSLVKTDLASQNSRINFDATLAAKLYGGIAAGIGFTARWDRSPLGDRKSLDTATTLSLIYAFSDAQDAAEAAPTCPACPEIPPCPGAAPSDPTTPAGIAPPPAPAAEPTEPAPAPAAEPTAVPQ